MICLKPPGRASAPTALAAAVTALVSVSDAQLLKTQLQARQKLTVQPIAVQRTRCTAIQCWVLQAPSEAQPSSCAAEPAVWLCSPWCPAEAMAVVQVLMNMKAFYTSALAGSWHRFADLSCAESCTEAEQVHVQKASGNSAAPRHPLHMCRRVLGWRRLGNA